MNQPPACCTYRRHREARPGRPLLYVRQWPRTGLWRTVLYVPQVPTERAPTQRRVDEPPTEGVLAVEGLQQIGELVASMAEYAERERAQMYDDYGGGSDEEMPEAPPEEEADAPPDDD